MYDWLAYKAGYESKIDTILLRRVGVDRFAFKHNGWQYVSETWCLLHGFTLLNLTDKEIEYANRNGDEIGLAMSILRRRGIIDRNRQHV